MANPPAEESRILLRDENNDPGEKYPGTSFDLVKELLSKHKGVFFGYSHNQLDAIKWVTSILPQARKLGVTAVSFALPQVTMDTIQAAPDVEKVWETYPGMDRVLMQHLWTLGQVCKVCHVKLLGHEDEKITHQDEFARKSPIATQEELKNREYRQSLEGMNKRDEFAVNYIPLRIPRIKNKIPGKIFVIDGDLHSKKKSDSEDAKLYPGLNVRLGLPSIDSFDTPNDALRGVYLAKGEGADYVYAIPSQEKRKIDEEFQKLFPLPVIDEADSPAPLPDLPPMPFEDVDKAAPLPLPPLPKSTTKPITPIPKKGARR